MLVGTKVKEIAKKKGISLNQLEKDTKIATGSISKWDKISPSFEKVCNVAKALDVNVDELIGEWGQAVKKRYSHKKMRAWSEYPLITRISFVLSCTALVLAIARLLLK